ncbi:unnamed protein product [Larinioides sclopetarius]|uniref:Uncharacterized protein n=1 Tax=Larinioides sclopetarius TaxID=280406 RepID=A0AAV1ZLG4_9ARAC
MICNKAWNKDWKPGPYPRTKEERIAAAKKYKMLPEDYEPYPEEEGYGDYPMFKKFHMESRHPFEAYDYPELKRNYGEPIPKQFPYSGQVHYTFEAAE